MNKTIRVLLILALLVGVAVVAGSKTVWASPAAKAPEVVSEKANPALPVARSQDGTVIPEGCGGVSVNPGETKSVCGAAVVTGGDVFATTSSDGAVTLFFTSGSAQVCFAAPGAGLIHYQPHPGPDGVWVHMATSIVNGRACATVSDNGHYAFHE